MWAFIQFQFYFVRGCSRSRLFVWVPSQFQFFIVLGCSRPHHLCHFSANFNFIFVCGHSNHVILCGFFRQFKFYFVLGHSRPHNRVLANFILFLLVVVGYVVILCKNVHTISVPMPRHTLCKMI